MAMIVRNGLLALLAIGALPLAESPAFAAEPCTPITTNWTGSDSGDWNDIGNWDNGVPGACATANITASGTVTYSNTTGTAPPISLIDLNGGTLSLQTGSQLNDDMIVGDTATAMVSNTGGVQNVTGNLTLGNQSTGNGTYDLTAGGTTTVTGTTLVGNAGFGTFLNDASTHTTEVMIIGNQNGATGIYTLQGSGALNVGVAGSPGFFDVGENGTGTFNQTSGMTTIIGAFDIGRCGAVATATCNNGSNVYTGTAGIGTVNLSGGSISVEYDPTSNYGGFAKVGDAGTGHFHISGGASFTADSLDLALDGGAGYVTLSGTGSAVTLGTLGVGDNGLGIFRQHSGTTVLVGSGLDIGSNTSQPDAVTGTTLPTGNGSYIMTGGQLTIQTGNGGNGTPGTGSPGYFTIGDAGSGTFTQTGGTVLAGQAAGDGYVGQPSELFNMNIGNQTGSTGNYSISSGDQSNPASLTVNGNLNLGVSAGSIGNFTIGTSGLSSDATSLTVNLDPWNNGQNSTPRNGGNILVGVNGSSPTTSSTFTQNNGNVTAANDVAIGINSSPGIGGTYNMSGGTLTTPNLDVGGSETFSPTGGGGSGIFSQTGGLVTIGSWFGGQVLANGMTTPGGKPPSTEGTGVIGTLTLGAQGGNGLYQLGTGDIGGIALQTNTTTWGGYPDKPFTNPPAFDSVNNAPYLQIYGNAIIGADPGGGTSTFELAGDGTHLQINNVVGYSNQGTMVIGASGSGDFTQTDVSTVYLDGSVALGLNQGATGTYELTAGQHGAGSLSIGGDLEIGGSTHTGDPISQTTTAVGGTGTFTQSAGTVTVQGKLDLGVNGGSGTYIGSGTLTVNNNLNIGNGNGSTGTFTQNGGLVEASPSGQGGQLYIGNGSGTGTYNLNNGTLDVSLGTNPVTYLGQNGTGSLIQTGGDFRTGFLNDGTIANGSVGTYTISGGTAEIGSINVGGGSGSTGALTMNSNTSPNPNPVVTSSYLTIAAGGTVQINGGVMTVDAPGTSSLVPSGTLNIDATGPAGQRTIPAASMSGGSLSVANTLNVGIGGGGPALFTQTGGTVTVGQELLLGNSAGDNGTYLLSAPGSTTSPSLVVTGSGAVPLVAVGAGGTGTLTESNGAYATNAATLVVGGPSLASGTGMMTITGSGTQWINAGQIQIGAFGTGTLNVQKGGYLEGDLVSGTGTSSFIGGDAGSTGTVLVDGSGSKWNMPNGALRVGVSSAGSGNDSVSKPSTGNLLTISNGGAVIDSAGNGSDGQSTDDGAAATVGWKAGSVGTVNVSTAGTWTNNGDLVIGDAGTGAVTIDNTTGSSVSVGGNLLLGNLNSGNGTLTFADASSLNLTNGTQFLVGNAGTGMVNQSGGDLNLAGQKITLDIGVQNGSTGTYNLLGGSLEDDLIVGNAGTGTFNNSAGSHTVNGNLTLGNQATGNGTYDLSGSGSLGVTGTIYDGAAGKGQFTQAGATAVTALSVSIGNNAGGTGEYDLTGGGTLTISGLATNQDGLFVGSGGTGTLRQSGTDSIVTANQLSIGNNPGGIGYYYLSAGQLSIAGNAYVGADGTGTYAQTGGSAGVTGSMALGNVSTGIGTATVSAGTLTVGGGLTINAANASSPSSFTVNGSGGVDVTGAVIVNASGTPNGTSLTVDGNGSLSAATITNNDQLNLQGGTTTAAVTNNGTMTSSEGNTAALNGNLTNSSTGSAGISGGSSVAVTGLVSNAGDVTVASTSTLSATGSYTQSGGTTQVNGSLNTAIVNLQGGLLEGNGSVGSYVSNIGGTVKGGDSPGALTITGDYNQAVGGTLEEQIGGTATGAYDQLLVDGTATLAGALDVQLIDGFTFTTGATEKFDILGTGDGLTNGLTSLMFDGNTCAASGMDQWTCNFPSFFDVFAEVTMDPGSLVSGSSPEDLQLDVTQTANSTPPPPVPEPSSLLLLGSGLFGLVFWRRRHRRAANDKKDVGVAGARSPTRSTPVGANPKS